MSVIQIIFKDGSNSHAILGRRGLDSRGRALNSVEGQVMILLWGKFHNFASLIAQTVSGANSAFILQKKWPKTPAFRFISNMI